MKFLRIREKYKWGLEETIVKLECPTMIEIDLEPEYMTIVLKEKTIKGHATIDWNKFLEFLQDDKKIFFIEIDTLRYTEDDNEIEVEEDTQEA